MRSANVCASCNRFKVICSTRYSCILATCAGDGAQLYFDKWETRPIPYDCCRTMEHAILTQVIDENETDIANS